MAFCAASDAAAAMAVDRETEGAGAHLGPEENIDDDVMSNLLSASWPTPAVVDDEYRRYCWTLRGGSFVEQRFDAVDSSRMTSMWTTIRGLSGPLFDVPVGTVTDFPFLRSRDDWRVCYVVRHLAVCDILAEVWEKPHFSWENSPGSPPSVRGGGQRRLRGGCDGAVDIPHLPSPSYAVRAARGA